MGVECSVEDRNEWRWWQCTRTSTERTGGISTVGGGKAVTIDKEIDRGDGIGKVGLLGGGVCSGNQSSACLIERRWVVYPGVVTLEGRVVEDKGHEDRVTVEVNEEELMSCDEWVCKWE